MKIQGLTDHFESWELEAFAEGVDMPHVQQFVQNHPQLWSSWLHGYQKEQSFYAILTRFDCPSPVQLHRYYWNELSKVERSQLDTHLATCASCTSDLATLVETLAIEKGDAPASMGVILPQFNLRQQMQTFSEQIRTIIASFVPPLMPEFAAMALRGDELIPTLDADRPATLLFNAEEIDISLVAMKEVDGQIFLSGQVLTADASAAGNVKIVPAAAHEPEIDGVLDESGSFVINNLPVGYCHLTVTVEGRSLVIPNLLLQ